MLIYLIGFMGSGKTTAGKKLARRLAYNFIDLDALIESETELTISELFNQFGEDKFRQTEQKALRKTFDLNDTVISTGGGVPCFFNNIDEINKNGISIYLEAEPAFLKSRLVLHKNKRPLIANIADADLEAFLSEMLQIRQQFYKKALLRISAKSVNVKSLIEEMKKKELID